MEYLDRVFHENTNEKLIAVDTSKVCETLCFGAAVSVTIMDARARKGANVYTERTRTVKYGFQES